MAVPPANPIPKPRSFLRRQFLPTWEERKRMFAPQAWIVLGGSYLAVIFAYVLPEDFRNTAPAYVVTTWAALLIRTFLFHLGLFVSLIALLAGVARKWRLLTAALPLLGISLGPAVWSLVPRRHVACSASTITVMTVNLLYANETPAPIVAEICAARPDVLLVQEYTAGWHNALQAALSADYPYYAHTTREDSFGLAAYSRTPFEEEAGLNLTLGDGEVPQARAVIPIGGRKVAFYNIHLLPPRNLDYCTEQRRAFGDLIEVLEHEALPIVLGGDLNFTNESPFADQLRNLGLHDVHVLSGYGRGATWPVLGLFRAFPGIRLDHIYISKELSCSHSRTGVGQGSDHRPVVAELGFAPDACPSGDK